MENQRRICTFCMGQCETFKYIEINTKNILDLFLPKMDFSIIQGTVMCGKCAEALAKCFEFKTTCLHTYDYLVSFVNNKDDVKLDLNDLFQSRSMTDTGTPEDQGICGFCMGLVKNCNAIPLYNKDEDYKLDKMVQQCLPELDLSVIKKPVICADCHSSLESCFHFVTDCLTAEQRIRLYRENLISKGQVELSDLLHPAIKTENTNDMDIGLFDIVKIEKQICAGRETPVRNEMVSGVNVIKLEEMSCINENSNNNENVYECLVVSDNPTVSDEQQWSPKNVLVREEESNKLGAIKIEETLCEESKSNCKDDMFVEKEDKECLIDEEIEIKTEGHDFNRFEEGVEVKTKVNTRLNENCLMPTLEEHLSNPPFKQAFMEKNVPGMMTYQCKRCSFQTNNRNNFETHLSKHKYSSLTHKEPTDVTVCKCDSCTFQTRYTCYLNRRSLKHNGRSEVPMFECYSCPFQTIYKSSMRTHSLKHKDPSEVTMYKCDSCTYQTRYREYFRRHSLRHKNPSELAK